MNFHRSLFAIFFSVAAYGADNADKGYYITLAEFKQRLNSSPPMSKDEAWRLTGRVALPSLFSQALDLYYKKYEPERFMKPFEIFEKKLQSSQAIPMEIFDQYEHFSWDEIQKADKLLQEKFPGVFKPRQRSMKTHDL